MNQLMSLPTTRQVFEQDEYMQALLLSYQRQIPLWLAQARIESMVAGVVTTNGVLADDNDVLHSGRPGSAIRFAIHVMRARISLRDAPTSARMRLPLWAYLKAWACAA